MPLFSLPCSQRISFFNSTTEAKKAVTATNTSQRRKPLYKFLVMFNLQERDSGYSKASAEEEPELEVPNGSSKGRELEVTKSFFKNHGSRKRSSNFTSLAVSSFLAVIHVSQFQLFLNSYQGRVSMFCKATKVSKCRFVCLYLEMRPERLSSHLKHFDVSVWQLKKSTSTETHDLIACTSHHMVRFPPIDEGGSMNESNPTV